MKYHALFVIFEKIANFEIVVCCKIIGGALRVNPDCTDYRIRFKKSTTRPLDKSMCFIIMKIIFLISQPKHMLWVLRRNRLKEMILLSTKHPKQMLETIFFMIYLCQLIISVISEYQNLHNAQQ